MATYYISKTGNDSTGDGSSATPWRTPQPFHAAYSSGDTLILKDGTYYYNSTTDFPVNHQFEYNGATYQGETRDGCIISDDGTTWITEKFGSDGSTVTIKDMTFKDILGRDDANSISAYLRGITYFTNCIWRDIDFNYTKTYNNYGFIGGYGESGLGYTTIWTSCFLYNFYNSRGATYFSTFFISRNTVDAAHAVTIKLINCLWHINAIGADAFDNILHLNGTNTAAYLTWYTRNTILFNDSGSTITISGTLVQKTHDDDYSTYYNITLASGTLGANSSTTAPVFVDSANEDYHLAPSDLENRLGTNNV